MVGKSREYLQNSGCPGSWRGATASWETCSKPHEQSWSAGGSRQAAAPATVERHAYHEEHALPGAVLERKTKKLTENLAIIFVINEKHKNLKLQTRSDFFS